MRVRKSLLAMVKSGHIFFLFLGPLAEHILIFENDRFFAWIGQSPAKASKRFLSIYIGNGT